MTDALYLAITNELQVWGNSAHNKPALHAKTLLDYILDQVITDISN